VNDQLLGGATVEQIVGGAAVAALIAFAAVRVHALTRSGAIAAFAVGALTFAAGTLGSALILLAFFLTSVAFSRAGKKRKRELVDIGKGGPRDAWQVLANGGIATACLLVWAYADHSNALSPWFAAFAGAYAAATADTWGTEIGTLAAKPPRSILTGKVLATGLSGGVSSAGTAAEIAGAVLIAVLTPAALLLALPGTPVTLHTLSRLLLPVFVGGFGGALIDSLLGATLQDRRWCPACQRECEVSLHGCGTTTERRRGLPWLTNDAVNFAATAIGAAIASAVWIVAP
jgi:uncharacterized protein (TIGR00297 family)